MTTAKKKGTQGDRAVLYVELPRSLRDRFSDHCRSVGVRINFEIGRLMEAYLDAGGRGDLTDITIVKGRR